MEERININKADVETLASLPGIGSARAAKIVAYRSTVHPFEEVIELAAVSGISERMVRAIADLIVVDGTAEAEATNVAEIGPEVEELVVETVENPNGSEAPIEQEPVESVEEETAEPDLPVEEASVSNAVEEDDSPVVVTMLDENQSRPEPVPEPETAAPPEPTPQSHHPSTGSGFGASTGSGLEDGAGGVIERRVVETVERRHFHLTQQLVGVVVGAVLGSGLTLLFLFLLNGTLHFTARTTDLQLELDDETSNIRQAQSRMTEEMGTLTGRVTELDNELAASNDAIDTVEGDVSDLEAETAVLNERLEAIDLSAEKFDAFLTGLRDLLVTLQGLPPSPTSTISISGTATITTTLTPEGTAESPAATPSPAPQTPEAGGPTRTPRPTATPIIE